MWILSIIFALTPHTFAEEVPVQLLGADTAIEEIISSSASHANADVSGKGSEIILTYTTAEPLSVFIAFRDSDGSYNTFETLQAVLPAGSNMEASIDVTKSPAWNPSEISYRLYFFSDAPDGAEFHDIEFKKAGLSSTVAASIKHIAEMQPYSPASYHRLPGYTVLGIPLAPVVGWLLILLISVLIIRKRIEVIIPLIVVIILISHARFSLDTIRLSVNHSVEWISNITYATAGSLPHIARRLREEDVQTVYLCHTGTTYAKKLLQYHAYPTLIVDQSPSHILVHKSTNWSIEGDELRCIDDTFTVLQLEDFEDGSTLYQIQS